MKIVDAVCFRPMRLVHALLSEAPSHAHGAQRSCTFTREGQAKVGVAKGTSKWLRCEPLHRCPPSLTSFSPQVISQPGGL